MDRSFIISGLERQGESVRPIAGVLFSNSPPDMEALSRLGFFDIQSVDAARPLSNQPTEPTLYIYGRSPAPASVTVIRLDWANKEVNRARVAGEPSFLVPPVAGPAADKFLYPPRAFVISANVKDMGSSKPVVAVLFIKPLPGEAVLQPDKKTLNRLGLVDLQTVERVETAALLQQSMLYLFERTPAAKGVGVAKVSPEGTRTALEELKGEPHSLIPQISGSAADRFVNPRGAPSSSDFPKAGAGRPSDAPISARAQRGKRF
jgi:hypothetical protein